MEIKGENLKKILETISVWYCHTTFCKDCTHEYETFPDECCSKDCLQRICEVIESTK